MKNRLKYIMIVFIGAISFSCSEKYDIYNSDTDRLGFFYGVGPGEIEITDSVQQKTFAFYPSTVQFDTVWLEVRTMGYVYNHDRQFEFEQINLNGIKNAVSGVHYVAFDAPEVKRNFIIPAGQVKTTVPITLKRDPSLKDAPVTLKIRIKANENFAWGYPEKLVSIIEFADILMKPKGWNTQVKYHFGGEYSFEKFSFMVQVATWTLSEDWFAKNFPEDGNVEMGYAAFTSSYFVKALKEENKKRRAAGLDVLKEKVGTGERPIQFTKYNTPQPYEYDNE